MLERRPLSSRAIIGAAYRRDLIPSHLHGQTQHKTLGARISEDILALREQSLFFRAAPGRYFLRAFLADSTIPEEHRQPVATRRRIRDLIQGPALAVDSRELEKVASTDGTILPETILDLLRKEKYFYDDPKNRQTASVFLWSFVSVLKQNRVLSYRAGRYREARDTFLQRRCIGFSTLVQRERRTLFTLDDFGIVESGVFATRLDLDIPEVSASNEATRVVAALESFIWIAQDGSPGDLLAVVSFNCPRWFEPERRRLAINDLGWLDIGTPVNNIEDFDPWSRSVLAKRFWKSDTSGYGNQIAKASRSA